MHSWHFGVDDQQANVTTPMADDLESLVAIGGDQHLDALGAKDLSGHGSVCRAVVHHKYGDTGTSAI
jgi:hypothetical protein